MKKMKKLIISIGAITFIGPMILPIVKNLHSQKYNPSENLNESNNSHNSISEKQLKDTGDYTYTNEDQKLTVSKNVADIPSNAFMDGTYEGQAIKKIEFATDSILVSIGDSAFENVQLAQLILPNSIVSIGDYAFEEANLTEFIKPIGLVTIGKDAFKNSFMKDMNIFSGSNLEFFIGNLPAVDNKNSIISHFSEKVLRKKAFVKTSAESLSIDLSKDDYISDKINEFNSAKQDQINEENVYYQAVDSLFEPIGDKIFPATDSKTTFNLAVNDKKTSETFLLHTEGNPIQDGDRGKNKILNTMEYYIELGNTNSPTKSLDFNAVFYDGKSEINLHLDHNYLNWLAIWSQNTYMNERGLLSWISYASSSWEDLYSTSTDLLTLFYEVFDRHNDDAEDTNFNYQDMIFTNNGSGSTATSLLDWLDLLNDVFDNKAETTTQGLKLKFLLSDDKSIVNLLPQISASFPAYWSQVVFKQQNNLEGSNHENKK